MQSKSLFASLFSVAALLWVAFAISGCASSVNIGSSNHRHDGDECHEVIRAQRFELVDEEGMVRAEIGMDENGSTGVFIHDREGYLRASLTHDDEQTALYLWDTDGTIRVGTAQYAHGGGGFALHGAHSQGAAVLYLKDREGALTFYDDAGNAMEHSRSSGD